MIVRSPWVTLFQSASRIPHFLLSLLGCGLIVCAAATAQNTAPNPPMETPAVQGAALPEDGPAYTISEFRLQYVRDNPKHPPVEDIMAMPIELGRVKEGYVAPRPDVESVTITLADASAAGMQTYYASGLQRIIESVRDYLVKQHLLGVYVAPDPLQINETGNDLRKPQNGKNPLTLTLATGSVTRVRTLGSGERVSPHNHWAGAISPEDRIDNKVHKRIIENSPIKPYEPGEVAEGQEPPPQEDLLRQDVLDRYLFHLSRHPGRRVDASVAADDAPGGVILDYQVTENRPLTLYAQFSNTGTKATDYWRERFGFLHTQLTNHDDILSFDYITSWFDKTNAVLGSYEAPIPGNDRIRWRIYGNWTEFTADDVGFFGQDFTGESWAIGGELSANIFQQREMFIDVFGGARFENIKVDNQAFLITGDEDFIVPYVGLRYDRRTDWFSTQASIQFEWWLSDATSADLSSLGRTAPDEDAMVFKGALTHSVYLEPVLNHKKWASLDPKASTLAHEIVASVRGQYAFDNRLIPQAEQVVGGLYTVRGYPESILAGDSVIIGSIEYRIHLPRLFDLEPEPRTLFGQPFRRAPQYVFGPVDWDLVPKAFFDIGRTFISDPFSFEKDETLMGAGIGIDLLYRRNINVRLDWGFVLDGIDSPKVNYGSNRLHFVATILF